MFTVLQFLQQGSLARLEVRWYQYIIIQHIVWRARLHGPQARDSLPLELRLVGWGVLYVRDSNLHVSFLRHISVSLRPDVIGVQDRKIFEYYRRY